jgi:hypothetical protein
MENNTIKKIPEIWCDAICVTDINSSHDIIFSIFFAAIQTSYLYGAQWSLKALTSACIAWFQTLCFDKIFHRSVSRPKEVSKKKERKNEITYFF